MTSGGGSTEAAGPGWPRESLRRTSVAVRRTRRRLVGRPRPNRLTARLVPSPVFVFCSVRSGSTLLRLILNSHSRICAPHEMHFNDLNVAISTPWSRASAEAFGLSPLELRNVLWDRLMYGLLAESDKEIFVDKTPQNAAQWERIHAAWPQARYIHLRRHPAAILRSRVEASPDRPFEQHLDLMLRYGDQLDAARAALPGPTVRYEDLTVDPAGVARTLCAYLDVPYEPAMIDYTLPDSSELQSGLGDWSAAIRSGGVQAARSAPDEAPEELARLIAGWGY